MQRFKRSIEMLSQVSILTKKAFQKEEQEIEYICMSEKVKILRNVFLGITKVAIET